MQFRIKRTMLLLVNKTYIYIYINLPSLTGKNILLLFAQLVVVIVFVFFFWLQLWLEDTPFVLTLKLLP